MAITSYSELVTAVGNWMARSDLSARIPEFIALAEAKFNRDLAVRQMEQRSTATVDTESTGPEFISLPSDFQSMRWLRLSSVTGKPRLQYLTPVQIDEYRACNANAIGQPCYFSLLASDIELCPTPDSDYTLEMLYRRFLTPLSDSNTSNWLLALAPDLYLYGALREAAVFMEQDERVPLWASGYQSAIEGLSKLNNQTAAGPMEMRLIGAATP
jgi:hypothetical protein